MFEEMTYENILSSVLNRVSDDLDKRQGSIIYDAVAPACAELAQAYIQMENALDNSFANTATREYLVRRASESGLVPYEATCAVARGVFEGEVPIGSRFNVGSVNFVVSEKIKDYEYKMTCETEGTEGNKYFGSLVPIEYIDGITDGILSEILIPGRDEEDTEDFRSRYFDTIYGNAFGGNKADYVNNTKAIDGVGQVRVERVNESNSNVRVIIWGADNTKPSQSLLNSVKEALDPSEASGYGEGLAPIGHCVSVESATIRNVVVEVVAEFESEYNIETMNKTAEDRVKEFFSEINSNWEDYEKGIEVYSAQLMVRLLGIDGIKNIVSLTVGGKTHLELNSNEIIGLDYLDFVD